MTSRNTAEPVPFVHSVEDETRALLELLSRAKARMNDGRAQKQVTNTMRNVQSSLNVLQGAHRLLNTTHNQQMSSEERIREVEHISTEIVKHHKQLEEIRALMVELVKEGNEVIKLRLADQNADFKPRDKKVTELCKKIDSSLAKLYEEMMKLTGNAAFAHISPESNQLFAKNSHDYGELLGFLKRYGAYYNPYVAEPIQANDPNLKFKETDVPNIT